MDEKIKKDEGSSKLGSQNHPDYQIKPVNEDGVDESPKIYKALKREDKKQNRRDFIKNLTGILSLSALAGAIGSCETSEYSVSVDSEKCRCHVVCSCDTESDKDKSKKDAEWGSNYNGTVCTCDTVCTCNTVCTCDTVCGCDGKSSCSSCGGGYWYPC